jgi:hypothetical protein
VNLSPIIVVGCPRSGTSVVARILQENCDIMMDEGPIKKDSRNPKGYYEDHRLQKINTGMIARWKFGADNLIDQRWAVEFAEWIVGRGSKYDRWGFKDPAMIGFIHWTFQFFKDPVFIWTYRNKKKIVDSQMKKLGFNREIAERGVDAYNDMLNKHLKDKNLHKINLTNYMSESKLNQKLEDIINGS